MSETFEREGYHFQEVRAIIKQRPYRVRCIETGDFKDSEVSYGDAAMLILQEIKFAESHSQDVDYVKQMFINKLLGKTKGECDEVIKEMNEQHVLDKYIVLESGQGRLDRYKTYRVGQLLITVYFDNGPAAS